MMHFARTLAGLFLLLSTTAAAPSILPSSFSSNYNLSEFTIYEQTLVFTPPSPTPNPTNLSCIVCNNVCSPSSERKMYECEVCFKRIVSNTRAGRGGAPNRRSVHRGCKTMAEVLQRGWDLGTCSSMNSPGDEYTHHFQCLCNDKDECNAAQGVVGVGRLLQLGGVIIATSSSLYGALLFL